MLRTRVIYNITSFEVSGVLIINLVRWYANYVCRPEVREAELYSLRNIRDEGLKP